MRDAPALLRKPQTAGDFATRADVEALHREVRELRAVVDQPSRRRPLADADLEWLASLLPAIAAAAADCRHW